MFVCGLDRVRLDWDWPYSEIQNVRYSRRQRQLGSISAVQDTETISHQ
jgi:hypothetical protein